MHNDQPQNPEELSMDAFLARESIELHKADLARKNAVLASQDASFACQDASFASQNTEIKNMALRFLRSLQGKSDADIMQTTRWTPNQLNHYRALAAAD